MIVKRGDKVKLKREIQWMYTSDIHNKVLHAAKKDDGVRVWLTGVGPVELSHLVLVKEK